MLQIAIYSTLNIKIDNFKVIEKYKHYSVSNTDIYLITNNPYTQENVISDLSALIGINSKILEQCLNGSIVNGALAFYLDSIPLIRSGYIKNVIQYLNNDFNDFNLFTDYKLIEFDGFNLELSDFIDKKLISDYTINTLINRK